jgi:glutamine synthetase
MTDLEQIPAKPPQRLQETLARYQELGVRQVKLGLTDIDGVIRGKYVGLQKFAGLMHKQGGFCDCVFGWDLDDQLYDAGTYTGWHSGFPDTGYRLLVESERWLAEEECPYFIAEFVQRDGSDHPLCPRTRLRTVLDNLAEQGLAVRAGFEYEFFLFDETPHSIRDKGYRNLTPISPGNFGYSVLRTSALGKEFIEFMNYCADIDCELEGLHCETGPGVWEAALASTAGLEAADRASLFKTMAKGYFQRRLMLATFMAKWSMDYPGQSGHLHLSLSDADGQNIFYDATDPAGISQKMRQAVAGLQRYLPEFLSMLAPTVNSYTRLVKGAWAPTAATWGIENRTAAIRVIPGDLHSQRIEVRVGGADANPYLVQAAALAAMNIGMQEQLSPNEPVAGNAYEAEDGLPLQFHFASDLSSAANRFGESTAAKKQFGETFVEHFAMTRQWEASEYHRTINSWQLERYFEIV